jgi:hypothetical protein
VESTQPKGKKCPPHDGGLVRSDKIKAGRLYATPDPALRSLSAQHGRLGLLSLRKLFAENYQQLLVELRTLA